MNTERAIESVCIREKCKGFLSPGTKQTVRVITKCPYFAGVCKTAFDCISISEQKRPRSRDRSRTYDLTATSLEECSTTEL